MARYQREFRWDRDYNTGDYGWIPEWLDGVDEPFAMIGEGTAHDALEHEAHESDGNLETETRALGAVYFVRGESGWFGRGRSNPDPEYHISGDFIELFRAFQNGDRIGDAESVSDPREMATTFRAIVRAGIRNAIAEYRRDPEDRETLVAFAKGRRWLESLMIAGYYAARERFDGNCCNARYLFERIADAAKEAAHHASDIGSGRLLLDVDTLAGKFHAVCELYENPTFGDGPLDAAV